MENILLAFLFVFGTIFGSFASVLVHRLKSGKGGILTGRSECPHCWKILWAKQLVPIFSWMFQEGKCSFCKKPIPVVYPALEIVTGTLFALTGSMLCDLPKILAFDPAEITRLFVFLFLAFATVTYVFYDLMYTEVPDEVMVPAILILLALLAFLPEGNAVFRHYALLESKPDLSNFANAAIGAVWAYTFFYLQFLIPATSHFIRKKEWKHALEVFAYYALLPLAVTKEWALGIIGNKSTDDEEVPEIPSWIGLGDLRIALLIGLALGAKMTAVALFCAYVAGSIYGIYVLAVKRQRNVVVPFWPFLAVGFYASLFAYLPIVNLIFPLSNR